MLSCICWPACRYDLLTLTLENFTVADARPLSKGRQKLLKTVARFSTTCHTILHNVTDWNNIAGMCCNMQEVVTMCHNMSQSDINCRKVAENCRQMLQSVANCRKLSQFVANCRELSRIVANCRELSRIVANCRELSRIVANCRELSQIVANFLWHFMTLWFCGKQAPNFVAKCRKIRNKFMTIYDAAKKFMTLYDDMK